MPQHPHPAVVIGGGICGLATTAALAKHRPHVTLVETDALPTDHSARKGTPQAAHVHGLLALGAQGLDHLFPGPATLRDELEEAGAPVFDHGGHARTQVWAGTIPQMTAGVTVQTVHRDVLEAAIRRRILDLPNVDVLDATTVQGLRLDGTGTRVTGLSIKTGAGREGKTLDAELVVDASGRRSKLPHWLEDVGYPRPDEEIVDARLAYTSRVYETSPQPVHGLQQINQCPDRRRGAYAADIGNGRWIVTLFGAADDHAPTDEDGFASFAASLNNPDLNALLTGATPLDRPQKFAATANRRRKFSRLPDGLITMGDALCAYNPVFGQGMTVAIHQATLLEKALAQHTGGDLSGFTGPVQRKIARAALIPWLMSTSEDRMWKAELENTKTPLALRAAAWYKQRLLHQAVHSTDPAVFNTFLRVYHMLKSPAAMAAPRILAQALLRGRNP